MVIVFAKIVSIGAENIQKNVLFVGIRIKVFRFEQSDNLIFAENN